MDATVHYPFHPYFDQTFKLLQRSGSVTSQVTLEKAPGKTFTVPLWMTDPIARELKVSSSVTIDISICLEIVDLLDTNCFAAGVTQAKENDGKAAKIQI